MIYVEMYNYLIYEMEKLSKTHLFKTPFLRFVGMQQQLMSVVF